MLNSGFTAICSMSCLLASNIIAHHTALPDPKWVMILGGLLLSFVPMLLFGAWKPYKWLIRLIILLDWGYVLLVVAFLIVLGPKSDFVGLTLAIVTALFVGMFATLQQKALNLDAKRD